MPHILPRPYRYLKISRNVYINYVWAHKAYQRSFTCLGRVYDTFPGWLGGSYSDIKTNLSQVGLDWDWPTGLSLAITKESF